jgi:hypothetical protein
MLTCSSFFFICSIIVEIVLVRHRRKEARFGPSPANNYTSGYGGNKFFGLFKRRGATKSEDPNVLPEFTHPDQVRQSYNTETTAVGHEPVNHNKYGESGVTDNPYSAPAAQPAGYRYADGTYNA